MKNSRSISLTEEPEDMIREAQIMLRGTDPEQRERGLQILREVVEVAAGSVCAEQALEILIAAQRRPPESPDPELDELMGLWPSMQGFNDPRLAGFLRRLESYHGMAVPLRTEVIRESRRWIADVLPDVGTEASSTKTNALNDFVAAVRGVAAFEELPEFGQLRDRLFQIRLQATAARVDAALAGWGLEEAQRAINELKPVPDTFKADVERLKTEIDEIDLLKRNVDRLLRQLPAQAPENWFEARLQAELQLQLDQCRTNNRVPRDWRRRLAEALGGLSEFIGQFIRAQAQAAVTIPRLRDFWTEFQRLQVDNAGSRAQLSDEWFAAVGDALAATAFRDVEHAKNADELTAIANRLRAGAAGIPPPVASRLSTIADDVNRTGTIWRTMEEGQSFALPEDGSLELPIPRALAAEIQRYSDWIEQIEAVSSLVDETSSLGEQDYQNYLGLAESILAQVPHHALARKLQHEATRRLTCYQLDQALSSWNVESFFNLFDSNSPGELYTALVAYRHVLIELKTLTQQPSLKDWRSAGDWWVRWHAATRRLPSARPDALIAALDQQSARRRLERYATLDRLLQDKPLSPREYENAAASLDDDTDSNLKSYQQELLRKAIIGRIEKHIGNGRLDDAASELGSLPPESTDAIRLRTRLEFEQARRRGNVAAADYLFHEWENVRAYLDQPEQLLLQTVGAVWREEQYEAVRRMSLLISRLLRETAESQVTQKLTEWQTWIEIEEELLRNFSSRGVKQLAEYLRSAERGELLDDRLKRILRHWKSEGNIVMLAWAYQAFQRVTTAARDFHEAVAGLAKQSDLIANDVEKVLAGSAILELHDLQPLQSSLHQEEERWRSLDDYLSLLPHAVERPQPSPKLIQAKQRVNEVLRILTLLASLKDADLRRELAGQDYDDAYSRALRLRDTGSRGHMLEQLERLRPLREDLFSLQQRIHEIADRCCSKEALNVLEPSLFHRLAGYVRKAAEIFVEADARNGSMWTLVSTEYESTIYREACVLLPVSGACELDQLVEILEELHAEESRFTEAISFLEDREGQPKVAWGGDFDPKLHLEYLALIPPQAPRSLKCYHRFERARRDRLKLILEAPESRPHLPVWVLNYLDNGVPTCASGH
ncbi:MAG TPA: hypothetical protein VJT15_05955 [Pyrinomonadaceae bacterium]|nr:hypothetical protein [Pyrinomonadaceae bacterium]